MVSTQRSILAIGISLALAPSAQAAGERAQSDVVAFARIRPHCALTPDDASKGDAEGAATESPIGLAAGTFLANLAGDIVGAVGNALGSALTEAAKEKAFSATGVTSFPFYKVIASTPDVELKTTLSSDQSYCLMLSYAGPTEKGTPPFDLNALSARDPKLKTSTAAGAWGNAGLPASPTLYVEAELQARRDGFVVRPVLVWYRQSMPGAPKGSLPAEIDFDFATPATATESNSIGTNFATVRIKLGALTPGEVKLAGELKSTPSPVIPNRPATGSPETVRSQYAAAYAALEASTDSLPKLARTQLHAQHAFAVAKADAKAQAQLVLDSADDAVAAANKANPKLAAAVTKIQQLKPEQLLVGTTNIQARFLVVRNANEFENAIGQALKTRATTLGSAVGTALTPKAPEPAPSAWSPEQTAFIQAKSTIDTAQRALDSAIKAGDENAIFLAQQQLRIAKANANAAAVPAKKDLPYPDLN